MVQMVDILTRIIKVTNLALTIALCLNIPPVNKSSIQTHTDTKHSSIVTEFPASGGHLSAAARDLP